MKESKRDDLLSRLSYNSEILIQSVWATILEGIHMKRKSECKLHTENEPLKTSQHFQSKSGANVSHILINSSHTYTHTRIASKAANAIYLHVIEK